MGTHPGPGAPLLAQEIHGRGAAQGVLAGLAAAGGGAVVALVGEAGIGKSRLAAWAGERARDGRRVVAEGRAVLGLAEPLGVFRDLVRFARRAELEPRSRDPLAAGFPAQLLPELGASTIERDNLGATFEAAARYLRALAGRTGLLAVLEDLHWADATSLSLVPFVARALRGEPVALLVTFRPEDESGSPALQAMRAEMRRERLLQEVALEPLSAEAAAAMLAEILGRKPAPEVQAELLRLSGGNPFALEELAGAVVESGWLDPATGRRLGTGAVTVPWTLAESIRARAARLAPPERETVEWAAATGDRFDVRLIARASGTEPEEVLARTAALIPAGLLVEAPGDASGHVFAFRHALVREALGQEGLLSQRRARHARILDAGEALVAEGVLEMSAAELARQAMAAGHRPRALAHSRAAAAGAEEIGAVEEAIAHLERALSLWDAADGGALRADLLVSCGRLRSSGARGDVRAVELLGLARDAHLALGDEAGAARCRALLAAARWQASDFRDLFAEWDDALATLRAVGARASLRAALAARASAASVEHRHDAALRMAEEGLALVPAVATADEARDRASLLSVVGMVNLFRCAEPAGRAALDEALRLAIEHHDDLGAARANYVLATGNLLMLRAAEVRERLVAATELVARHGLRSLQAVYLACQAWPSMRDGDWAHVRRVIEAAEELLDPDEPAEFARWALAEARSDLLLGGADLAGAEASRLALLERRPSLGSAHMRNYAHDGAALARLLAGDPAGARALLEPALEWYLDLVERGDAEAEMLPPKVQVLVAVGDLATARPLADWGLDLLPDHPQMRYCAALLELPDAPDRAAAEVEAAARGTEELGWTFVAACDRLVAAGIAAAVEAGRPAAVALVRVARERLVALGCEGWARRADETLRTLGERAPTRGGAGAGGLSARELEVLALVAEGLTNRQIAERLVISEHTAIRHVANVFRKLGATNRATAVRLATQEGLLDAGMASSPGHE